MDDEGENSGESHIEDTSGESHIESTDDDDNGDDDDTTDTGSPTLDPDARKPQQQDEARARRESGGPHDIHKMLAQMGHEVDGVDLNSGRGGSSPAQHGSARGGVGGGARRPSVAATMAPLRNTFTAKVARGRGGGANSSAAPLTAAIQGRAAGGQGAVLPPSEQAKTTQRRRQRRRMSLSESPVKCGYLSKLGGGNASGKKRIFSRRTWKERYVEESI